MADQWYYMKGQERIGPLSDAQIQALYERGEISDSSYVWSAGMPDWAPAGQVRDRFMGMGAGAGSGGNLMHDLGLDEPVVRPYTYTPGGGGGGYSDYAGFWLRVVASLIDAVVFTVFGCVLAFPLGILFGLSGAMPTEEQLMAVEFLSNTVGTVLNIAIVAAFECSAWQGTPGKKLLHIKVTDLDGNRISFLRAAGRNVAKILSTLTLGIGFIMAGFTERKQALHDMVAGCLVVRD